MGPRVTEMLLSINKDAVNTNILIVKVHGGIRKKDVLNIVADDSERSKKKIRSVWNKNNYSVLRRR